MVIKFYCEISFLRSSVPAARPYGVYIPELIHYFKSCVFIYDLIDKRLLSLLQGTCLTKCFTFKLKLSVQKINDLHHNFVGRYEIYIS